MHKHPNITSYFIECDDENVPRVEGDVFYSKGPESFRACILKTMAAFEYFSNQKFDYILRTNLSSLWNYTKLLEFVEHLPRTNVYAGTSGNCDGIPFVSGSGFLLSKDVYDYLIAKKTDVLNINRIDDVDIGKVLTDAKVPRTDLLRTDVETPNDAIKPGYIHYRVKMIHGDSRLHEPEIMKQILQAM
jgi:hypothetical protein